MNPLSLSIAQVADHVRRGTLSAETVVRAYLDRIERVDPLINAYLTVDYKGALRAAQEVDRHVSSGLDPGMLAGVPLAIKDNVVTSGLRTTCASAMLANWVPPYDATVIERLKQCGAVILGKANMDEFAMGSSNENSAMGPCRNPWNRNYVPGGSSGGSAAAVAARLCLASLGTDTGGSVRQPASLCGIVGVKPTYGRVSRYGLVALASSLDQIGPMTRTVADNAYLLQAIAGHDPRDMRTSPEAVPDYNAACRETTLPPLRLGIPKEYWTVRMTDEVRVSVENAIETLVELGATRVEVELPHHPYTIAAYYTLASTEASFNLARFDGVRYGNSIDAVDFTSMCLSTRDRGFGAEVKRRILFGSVVRSEERDLWRKAAHVQAGVVEDFRRAFTKCDLIVTPTAPGPAFRLGAKVDKPIEMYESDIFTTATNLAGLPALSLLCGLTKDRLPLGLQLIGPAFTESLLYRVAAIYEQRAAWIDELSTVTM